MRFDLQAVTDAVLALGFREGSYVVHAGAAMVLWGLTEEAGDIDIATDAAGWRHALTLGEPRPARIDQLIVPAAGIEVFSGWLGQSMDGLLARAQLRNGISTAHPADILEFKRRLNRPKDQAHIRLLEAFTCNNH